MLTLDKLLGHMGAGLFVYAWLALFWWSQTAFGVLMAVSMGLFVWVGCLQYVARRERKRRARELHPASWCVYDLDAYREAKR